MMQESFWGKDHFQFSYPSLQENLAVDVVVVGAGITGITAAYLMKQTGLKVALIEKGHWGSGETYCTTAHLSYVTDMRLAALVATYGRDHAQAAWHAGDAAILQIDENVRRESIDCDFQWVPGYLHGVGNVDAKEIAALRIEAILADELGFSASFQELVPLMNRPGVRYADQAQFHPLKYLAKLIHTIPGEGSHVFEQIEVHDVSESMVVKAGKYEIRCGYVVVATHVPIAGKSGFLQSSVLQTKLAGYNSYVLGARLPSDTAPAALYWDTAHPYNYMRVASAEQSNYVIFGGADHKTGQNDDTNEPFRQLEQSLREIWPDAQIEDRWSGQVIETNDGLPYIGEVEPRQFVATGFAGNGMTFGTLGAMMARDVVTQIANPWVNLFAPHRTTMSKAWNYIKEGVDYPYYVMRDRLTSAQDRSPETLHPGEGGILKYNGQKVAAFRNEAGELSMLSPVCPHMGCLVHWNAAETTWDCPCHGSRFRCTGEVHAGPAQAPLKELDTSALHRPH
ncbi:MAG: FAD-dependent oxidoreductase [Planctomycetota bacterium]